MGETTKSLKCGRRGCERVAGGGKMGAWKQLREALLWVGRVFIMRIVLEEVFLKNHS